MATQSTNTEAQSPTGDIKIFIDAFNKDFDMKLKSLLDAQQNYKNIYADAIKITTPKKGRWPLVAGNIVDTNTGTSTDFAQSDPKVVTIGDLFKYTFPDINSDKIIKPDRYSKEYGGWAKDLKDSEDEKISTMYDKIADGIRSNRDIENYQGLKKPGITNPSLWSPGQYYFDVFMSRMLSPSGPLKDPTEANGGGPAFGANLLSDSWEKGWLKANGGSASVSNFDADGIGATGSFGYSSFQDIISGGYTDVGIKYRMIDLTGIDISLDDLSTKPPTSFTSLFTQYRSGPLNEFISVENGEIIRKDPTFQFTGEVMDPSDKEIDFSKVRTLTDLTGYKFVGYYLHTLLYKAFIQAGDNYKSVVLPLRNPEDTTPVQEPVNVLNKVVESTAVGEVQFKFNVEKTDTFIVVGGTVSPPLELIIVPNDGTQYIIETPDAFDTPDVFDTIVDLDEEYQEEGFVGLEDSAVKLEYVSLGEDTQATITDSSTLSGPVEITKPKDGSMTISSGGLTRLKKHEGSRATVYDDKTGKSISSWGECAGFPTIGVGHLIQNNEKAAFSKFLKPGKMSDNEIDNLLLKDLQARIDALNKKLKVKVSQNQFDALLSMMFNTGGGNKSFLKAVSLTNEGKFKDAAAQIKSGPKTSKGVVLAGLERRRNEEAETYLA
jgi:lysozyme